MNCRLSRVLPPIHLDSDERLLVLRVISHNAVIVRQTNKQVKPRRDCHPERSEAEPRDLLARTINYLQRHPRLCSE
jgi:hypothetical protein